MTRVLRPSTLFITSIAAMFVAGPAISSTSAAPGDSPLSMRAAAMGIEPVAHRYMGADSTSITSMLSKGTSLKRVKKSSGTATVITAAMTSPMTIHLPMS